jgi:hypothetical protein
MNFLEKLKKMFPDRLLNKAISKTPGSLNGRLAIELYKEEGFILHFKDASKIIKWSAIESITAYKIDLFSTDEICINIVYNNVQTTITEETAGWEQFVEKTKQIFPVIDKNWDIDIVLPPFAMCYTILYQREDQNNQ